MSSAWRVVIHRNGGPEVLEREDFDPGDPGPGMALVRITAAGLNFIDTYQRSGLYALTFPATLGSEFVGVVEAVGDGVTAVKPGQRVGAVLRSPGAYATHIVTSAAELMPLPDDIPDEVAAAVLLKGLTAWALLEPCAKVHAGQTVLIHSAAGGVGSILVPWAKSLGATVIAHAGSAAKAERARQAGADHALSCNFDELAQQVRAITGGRGANVVLDGVGAASWTASLASTAPRGLIASYGNASGPVPPFSPLELARAGSLFLTRPAVFAYLETPEERAEASRRLFSQISNGIVPVEIGQRYALADIAEAHRALESRATVASTVLFP
jgi:NADPH2:quinone reductase